MKNEKSPVEIILEEADGDIENGKKDLINDGRNRVYCVRDTVYSDVVGAYLVIGVKE